MRRKSYADMSCSVARALDVVGDPWTLLVVRDAFFGFRRFEDFQRRLGVPRNTLTERLNRLTDAGVFEKVPYQDRPLRHEYRLTAKGRALQPVMISLMQWGDEWSDIGAPPVVLRDECTGEAVEPVLVDRRTGSPLAELRFRAVPNRDAANSVAPAEG